MNIEPFGVPAQPDSGWGTVGPVQTTSVPAVDLPRLVRPSWFKGDAACDWHEDAGHASGSYYCKCLDCDADFVGHKRRYICRKCQYEATARYDALTPEERAAFDENRNAEIRAFFETSAEGDTRRDQSGNQE